MRRAMEAMGYRRVWLRDHDGELNKRWARVTPFGMQARRWGWCSEWDCLLLPGGKVQGPVYVHEWKAA